MKNRLDIPIMIVYNDTNALLMHSIKSINKE